MTRRIRSTLAFVSGAILVPAVAHASMLGGRPIDVSKDGHRGDWLFDVTTISVSLLFVIMVCIMLGAVFMHREKAGDGRKYDEHDHGIGRSHLMLTATISSIIFFGVDGVLLVSSYNSLHEAFWNFPAQEAGKTVEVEVMAQQWGWNIRYPGADGKFNTPDDIVKWNEMTIPVDTPVTVKFKSKDVIHSFYLPNFRTKQDAIPGYTTKFWFQAVQTGEYEIGCAQHCGVNHYKMRGQLHVVPRADYDVFLKEAAADAARRYDANDKDAHWGWDWES